MRKKNRFSISYQTRDEEDYDAEEHEVSGLSAKEIGVKVTEILESKRNDWAWKYNSSFPYIRIEHEETLKEAET